VKLLTEIMVIGCLISLPGLHAQTLPPITAYTPEDYNADNQNWQICQSEDKYIYVANNRGLLEFNGSEWNLYPSPNNTIIRCVRAVGDRIYTGCYMEFGYWTRNPFGKMEYVSLLPFLEENLRDDDQIWSILDLDEWVIFQSTDKIYFFNSTTGKFRIIDPEMNIHRAYKVKDNIYFSIRNQGIYRMENGEPKLLIDDPEIISKRIMGMFGSNEHLIILTVESGFYRLNGNRPETWDIEANDHISDGKAFCGLQLSGGSFVVGTISDGVVHINTEGQIAYRLDQTNGLSNNTALSLFEDSDHNLWIGLDNGINCANITAPVKVFHDFDGRLGTVYTSEVFGDYLYLGTNQGLFCKKVNSHDPFRFIDGTNGQVWDLYNYNDEDLLCGHHLGTYVIKQDRAILIDDNPGTWAFRRVPGKDGWLVQGNYNGLSVLNRVSGIWRLRNRIDGFNSSARFFEFDNQGQIWVSHEYKGVYRLEMHDSLTATVEVTMEPFPANLKNSSLTKYSGDILYACEKGIYRYNEATSSFAYDSLLSPLITNEEYVSGKLIADNKGRLWSFSKENIYYAAIDHLTNRPQIESIPIPFDLRKVTQSFENIEPIGNDSYLLGTANGYLTIDLPGMEMDASYHIHLNSVTLQDLDNNIFQIETGTPGKFKFKGGILTIKYSVPNYNKYLDVNYQYQLEGHSNRWSDWNPKAVSQYENLSFGKYVFTVRAKVGNKLSDNIVTYNFEVERPWFLSNRALLLYLLMLVMAGLAVNASYKRHYAKKLRNEQLEKDKLIIELRNEQLDREIETKNRELALSKMNILKKNELLNEIKNELTSRESSDNIRSVTRLIDRNLNNRKDWEIFVKAFNEADKGFIDKLKSQHPNLTPHDLRFCVYLRMNLSSKEMAPLMNISVKSVETRRYRLRKRMNLPHEESLVNYILGL